MITGNRGLALAYAFDLSDVPPLAAYMLGLRPSEPVRARVCDVAASLWPVRGRARELAEAVSCAPMRRLP